MADGTGETVNHRLGIFVGVGMVMAVVIDISRRIYMGMHSCMGGKRLLGGSSHSFGGSLF